MIRLVLIDDHKVILDGLSSLIESSTECRVDGRFQDAKQALEYLDKHEADFVITDLDMPGMKGEEVVQ